MRWSVFAVVGFLVLALDTSFMGMFIIPRLGGLAPGVSIVLVVFVSLFAPRLTALVAAWLLGLMLDLALPSLAPGGGGGQALRLIGPHALGFVFASSLVLQLRTMVFRQRVVTIAALTFAAALAAAILAVALYVIRSWYGEGVAYPTHPSAMGELLRQIGIAAYSALLAMPVGWMLLVSQPLWGFQPIHQRRLNWR